VRSGIVFLVLLTLLLGGSFSDATEVFLGTTRPGFEKIPTMVLPFQGAAKDGERVLLMETVLQSDLERSQVFNVSRSGGIAPSFTSSGEPDSATIARASAAGVQVLVWAKLYLRGDEWVLEGYAFETAKGEQVVGLKIVGDEKLLRAMAHRFSDKLVSHFTGETGIAQTKIAYVSDLTGKKEVYLMDYDGANEMRITGDRSVVVSPRWSFDANQVSYTSYREGNPDIYFLDLRSGRRQRMISFPGLNFSTAWSPIGDRVAFATTKDGNAEIYTIRPDGTDLKRLTFNLADDLSPTWSPTGKQIAFTSDRGGNPQIYIMDADGANVARLTFSGDYNTSPAWSPKGDWIAYTCRNEEKRLKICAIRVDGQQTVRITESGPWDDESPSWALNGRDLVFTSNRTGKNQIFAIHADGTRLIRLTSNGANNTSPSWSPR
jgi:TolB protein